MVMPFYVGTISSSGIAAPAYLLQASFTGGAVIFTNGSTLGPVGSGATYEGYTEEGTLVVYDTSVGQARIISDYLYFGSLPFNNWDLLAVYCPTEIERRAGTVVKGQITPSAGTFSTTKIIQTMFGLSNAATQAIANVEVSVSSIAISPNPYFQVGWNGEVYAIDATGLMAPNSDHPVALVLGGFTGGVPSSSGLDGARAFTKIGGSWTLLAAGPSGNTAGMYLVTKAYTNETTNPSTRFDNFVIPNPAVTVVPEVFTPTGYALDTFTDANGTAATSHTADSGFSWTALFGTCDIQSNQLNAVTLGAPDIEAAVITDTGLSDAFISWKIISMSSWQHLFFRYTDSSNYWLVQQEGGFFKIYDRVAGSYTQRASVAAGGAGSVNSVRVSGTTIEAWVNGGFKISYTSSFNQTATIMGLGFQAIGNRADNFYVLPLTSTTYDTELDAI